MKTIAVLTDFSERAENAAKYALHLAEHLHANVKLYHSFFVPSDNPIAGQIVWPMENYEEAKLDSVQQLAQFATELKKEYSAAAVNSFKPEIEYECHNGDLTSYLQILEAEKDIVLLVMGNHKEGISGWLTGNHVSELIDKVTLPVLVIADTQQFSKIAKIAFATDLNTADVAEIHSLASLACTFNADIVLVHVADEKYDDHQLKVKVDRFLGEITAKINYAKIFYRRVKSSDPEHGLDWFAQHGHIDMLVMVHRHKTFFEKLFNGSISKQVATKIHLPLLIYPSIGTSLPVF